MKSEVNKPFGLLFEEPLLVDVEHLLPRPIYDENKDISFFIDANGNRIPFVELIHLGTRTETRVSNEGSDEDEENYGNFYSPLLILGTKTLTKTHGEGTDDDEE